MSTLLTPEDALQRILKRIHPLESETVSLSECTGRVLAEEVFADRDYPPYDRVMMDGIAFSSSSFSYSDSDQDGARFQLIGTVEAGMECVQQLEKEKRHGGQDFAQGFAQAFRINTGAALPKSCDTVVPIEEVEISGEYATLTSPETAAPNKFIHFTGSDKKAGELILEKGTRLHSAHLAILASVGQLKVAVHKLPRVHVLTTGEEAISPEEIPTSFQIRQSHPTVISAALSSLGVTDIHHKHLPDDREKLESFFQTIEGEADLIITCGAISKGTKDYLADVISARHGNPVFHGIAQRPGKPMAFFAKKIPVFALPGNALSTLICFHQYVAPALQKMMNRNLLPKRRVSVNGQLPEFHLFRHLPARLVSSDQVELLSPKNSGDFASSVGSDGYVTVPITTGNEEFEFTPWL